ncbi:MAG: beta-ketoacyl-ACP synthase II [Phycisphaerales bacterium]|nr:beta-ketoacyl-ACP synthase II [Phycisphaerales bacterium]
MSQRRVVVSGMGVVTSIGMDVDTFWSNLLEGMSGVRDITIFDASPFEVRIGGECRDYKEDDHFDRKSSKRIDRFAQLAIVAAREAAKSAGFDAKSYSGDPRRLGVILGSGIGGLLEFEQQHLRLVNKGPDRISAFTIPKLMINAASGNVAIEQNLQGISTTVGTACASAGHAMKDAFSAICHDECDLVFTGGSEAALTPLGLGAFAAMKALSTRNDDPARASRPFDRDRDGFILGEGAGLLVFEELEHAKARGATIHAEVLGFGATSDATHITQPLESGEGAAVAMEQALRQAKLTVDDINYINAHGTSTPLGDLAETTAIKRTFGPAAKKVAISSTKSSIGHLLGSSGGVETITTIMAMKNSTLPPTLNLDNPSEGCDLDYVPKVPRDQKIEYAMSNSFGFGGHNSSILLGQYKP